MFLFNRSKISDTLGKALGDPKSLRALTTIASTSAATTQNSELRCITIDGKEYEVAIGPEFELKGPGGSGLGG